MRALLPWLFLCLLLPPRLGAQDPGREVRVHDLRFLTRPVPQLPAGIWPSAGSLVLGEEDSGLLLRSVPISFTSETAEDEYAPIAPPGAGLSPETIAAVIRRNIAEDSWASKLNSLRADGSDLVIVQTREVHEAIARLLTALRARRARMVTVDVARVPVDALGGAWTAREPWLAGEELEAVAGRAGEKGIQVSLTAYNEQRVAGFTGRRTSRVTDTEVNQTGVHPVTNPVVESLPLGLSLEVLPIAISGTDWFRLEIKVTRLGEAGEAVKRETFAADLEFLPVAEESIETVLLVPAGRTAIAGLLREDRDGGEPRDFAIIARVRPVDVAASAVEPPRTGEAFSLRVHDVGFLLDPYPGEAPPLTSEVLEKLIRTNIDPEAWRDDRASLAVEPEGRLLNVTARAVTHDRVKAFLDGLIRERAAIAVLEVREIEGPLDDLLAISRRADAGVLLPADWRPAEAGGRLRETFRAVLPGALGSTMAARAYEARGYVADISTVSGGTGFSVLAMPDPELRSAGNGVKVDASVRAVHEAGRLAIELSVDRCATRFERTASLVVPADIGPAVGLPGAGSAPGEKDAGAPVPSTVWLPAVVDLPSQRRLGARATLALPPGRPAIIEVEAAGTGGGRMVIATVTKSRAFEEGR